jgi:hypothetical protein
MQRPAGRALHPFLLALLLLALVACPSRCDAGARQQSPTPRAARERAADQSDSIRAVDFANFKHPGSRGLFRADEYPTDDFTLRGGESGTPGAGMKLEGVGYGDVTGDGREEAFVTLLVRTDGTAGVHHVYVYTPRRGRPRFLWGFESGDRAWGGLRRVYAERGRLVVELYGRGTHPGGDLGSTEPVGLCCPRSFTRARYRWRRGAFRREGRLEVRALTPGDADWRGGPP